MTKHELTHHLKSEVDGRLRSSLHSVLSRAGLADLPFQIYVMLVTGLLFSFGRNLAFPYLAMYLTGMSINGGLEIAESLVGFMIMVGGLAYTLALLFTGSLCDRFGRRKMMIIFIVPQIFLTGGYAYATTFTEFLLVYVTMSVIGAFYDPAYSAMIADIVQPERREEVYGLSYMLANVGTVFGPLLGGAIASTSGYPVIFIYAMVFTIVCAAIILMLIKESYSATESSKVRLSQLAGVFKDKIFVVFCIAGALTNVVYSQLYGLLSVYTGYLGFDPSFFGLLLSVNGVMVVTLQIPIRKATMRIGSTRAFIVAQTLYAVGFTYFMLSRDLAQFLIGVVVLTLGEIVFFPASSGFVADLSPADMRGRYMALLGLFYGTGGSVGSLIGFTLYDILPNKGVIWGILGTVGFATLPGYLYLLKVVARRSKLDSETEIVD